MMTNNMITFALTLAMFLSLVATAAVPDDASQHRAAPTPATFPGYDIGVMTFNGTLGDYNVKLNGSIQEIFSQMQVVHPDFKSKISARDDSEVLARSFDGRICYPVPGQDWQTADTPGIQDSIKALDSISGCCDVGGTSCVRIACENSDAIWWCNNNAGSLCTSCAYLAGMAQDLVYFCTTVNGIYEETGGQEFDTGNFNIIVRSDTC